MKPRRPLPRSTRPIAKQSEKQKAKHGVQFSTIVKRGGKPKAKKRKPSEFARIYGSKQRVAWIKAQRSVASGKGPCENVHTATGGMGYKAGFETIVPLTREEHQELHRLGPRAFEMKYGLSLEFHAARIHQQFLAASLGVDD